MAKIIAHRGDPVAHRENTIPAFLSAVQAGADMIELDVQISKDGQCVILHDDRLNRLWNVDHAVAELTYDEIRRLTDGGDYEVPLLRDVLQAVDIPIMIDVKYANAILPIIEDLKALHAQEQALFSGGNLEAHRLTRKHLPSVQAALTWTESQLPTDELFAELRPNYLNPPWWLLLPGFDVPELEGFHTLGPKTVREMHDRGMGVSVWTVDEMEIAKAWSRLGVDAVITNRAPAAVRALR